MLIHKLLRRFHNQAGENGDTGSGAGSDTSFVQPAASEDVSTASDSTESDVNWDEIHNQLDADDLGGEEGDLVVEPSVEPTPTPAPAAAPAPATPAPVEPAPQPVVPAPAPAPAPAAPAPAPAPEVPDTPTNAPTAEQYQAWRAGREEVLATQLYAINDDDAAALLTEPEKILPRMAARMHMEVLEHAMQAIQASMPMILADHTQATQRETSARSLFSSVNPDLNDPRLEPAIIQLGTVYRKMNSQASPEEAARAIGALVRASLNMPAPVAGGGVPPAAVVPTTPAAPVPFTPARGSGSGASRPAGSENFFEQMAEDFLKNGD